MRQGAYLIDNTVALNVDFGSGTTAMPNLTGISYVKADETPGTLAPDAMTVTSLDAFESIVRFTAEGEIFSGSDWKLVLSNDADGSVELPFDLIFGNRLKLDIHHRSSGTLNKDVVQHNCRCNACQKYYEVQPE